MLLDPLDDRRDPLFRHRAIDIHAMACAVALTKREQDVDHHRRRATCNVSREEHR